MKTTIPNLQNELRGLGRRIDRERKSSLREAAKLVVTAAKANAPRGATGQYRQKIRYRIYDSGDNMKATVRSRAPHGHLVTAGTVFRTQDSTGRATGAMPVNDHLDRAADKTEARAVRIMARTLDRAGV